MAAPTVVLCFLLLTGLRSAGSAEERAASSSSSSSTSTSTTATAVPEYDYDYTATFDYSEYYAELRTPASEVSVGSGIGRRDRGSRPTSDPAQVPETGPSLGILLALASVHLA
ncbi:uncharacterized protein LOC144073019 isoform X1 [Stigmatopora argus]